jgi:hypothetical protein
MNSTLKRKSQLIHKKHQFLPDEHSWIDQSYCRVYSCSVWTCNQFCRFQENGSSLFPSHAHALLDSNAFAMAFRYAVFSKMISTYDMFMVVWCGHGSSISSSNFFADIKRYINFRIPHFSISCLNGCFSGGGAYPFTGSFTAFGT